MRRLTHLFCFLLVAESHPAFAGARQASQAPVLQIYPKHIQLDSGADRQTFVVQWKSAHGVTSDVTKNAEPKIADDSIAKIEGNRIVPMANGNTTIRFQFQGQTAVLPVEVAHQTVQPEVVFSRDVLPILTKTGCNAGKCHGASRGKDGFHLSLFGYDPAGDYQRITREFPGRRINLAFPDESLLLRKATGAVAHTGGTLFEQDTEFYETIREWIASGATPDPNDQPQPIGLDISPKSLLMHSGGETHQLVVRVRYDNGTDRDISHLATFHSNDDGTAHVNSTGLLTTAKGGEVFILARFDEISAGIPVIVRERTQSIAVASDPNLNYIDELINAKLEKLQIVPSSTCSDSVFVRRVYLDVIGRLPNESEFLTFVNDKTANKRALLIDSLLANPAFFDLWVMKWGDLLQIRSRNQVSYKALIGFNRWLRKRLDTGQPLNETFREIIAASGGTFENPPTNFYQLETNPRQLAENIAQVFLGIRIQCAQCHNHPFDRWTMEDYHGFTAFLSQVGYKQSPDPRELIVFNKGTGNVRHPVDDRVMQPRFLGGALPNIDQQDYRAVLAEWVTSPDNEFFARNLANRVWEHYFGRGIVEPVDDVRISNPPSNYPLWTTLGDRLIAYDYDIEKLARDICNSRTYQLSTKANPSNAEDQKYFSRALVRRIRAEVLLDCISQVTETKDKFARMPPGARAVQIVDGAVSNYFLDTFGRATRETVCACEVNVEPNLSQALHLINGETTTLKIHDGQLIPRLIQQGQNNEAILTTLYRRSYARNPLVGELNRLTEMIESRADRVEALEDVFWAVLNSKEFIFNH